jgi:hypothetical protein
MPYELEKPLWVMVNARIAHNNRKKGTPVLSVPMRYAA